ncbi:NHL repeat-containing protein [Anatilimnocola aggregata]|uniref:hypothetical protein n=1 Tax=Anatilimnocola aggregata TaxID=2528021 RepID=UPI0011A9A421|nr:hypothetical protein [Anatilimnocola aggregata]
MAQSSIENEGVRTPLEKAAFDNIFQLAAARASRPELKIVEGWQLTLVFSRPTLVGTSLLSASGAERSHFVAQLLRSEFAGSIAQAKPSDWQEISSVESFPADFRTTAIRVKAKRDYRGKLSWLVGKTKLSNLTPAAVGSGEQGPFGSHPNSIPLGRHWVNTGKDPRPNAPKQLQRGPISDATPSWYILSWDEAQTVSALLLSSNVDDFRLLAYRGQEGLNPAIAHASAWARVDFHSLHEQRGNGERLHDRLLTFPAVKTTALKLEMTRCDGGAVAAIGQMAALSQSALSAPPSASLAGKPIPYLQPFDGQVAMVITNAEGRTIRNLVAQVDRAKGPSVEHWDLKDHRGFTVPPGNYKWKAITSPPLGLKYQLSVYPNAPQLFPGQTPWQTGESGANGWLADHAPITSGAVSGDRVYFGAPGVEAGVCLIECDLTGRKLWGKHSFGPFVGVSRLAGDNRHLYIIERDSLHRLDPSTHKVERLTSLSSADRKGDITGFAAHQGQVAVARNSPVPWLENATRADIVDLEHCLPKLPERVPDPLGTRRVQPNPRRDFLRLLRLTGTPAGQAQVSPDKRETTFPITIDTSGEGKTQYILLAFKDPVFLGSLVLPCVGPEYLVDVSVLKPTAKYPPNPQNEDDWQSAPVKPRTGWTCIPMPPQVRTQGLRIRVRRAKDAGEDNLIDNLLAESQPKKIAIEEFDIDKPASGGSSPKVDVKKADSWFAKFEGLKLLRRRFTDVTSQAQIRVNSGEVNSVGEWDAQRKAALSAEDPGVYVMEWPSATKLAGLAIKEIDGAVTEIDVWDESNDSGSVSLTDSPGWRHVATYEQARRDSYEPSYERNDAARYLDGYVSFGGEVSTKAVRLRVVSQWADNGSPRATASLRIDQGGRSLDPRRCRIAGVAALQYLGDEAKLDTLAYQRLELRDGQTGQVVRELQVTNTNPEITGTPSSLSFNEAGSLFGIQNGTVVQIDQTTGGAKTVLPDIDGKRCIAHRLAAGPNSSLQVYVLPERVIHVYDQAGKLLRTLGHPGGQVPGPWDPEKFHKVENIVVDHQGQTWVVESQDVPRRIVQYAADGKFVREFYGNTHYGGGGVLDPADKSRLFYNHVEFAIDWQTGHSRIKNMLADRMPEDCIPMRYGGTTYLVRNPLSYNSTQSTAVVYRYLEEQGKAQLAAAFGEAVTFEQLKMPSILKLLADGKVLKDYTFLWSDRNGDGKVDAAEVVFELKANDSQPLRLGRFNEKLKCWAGNSYYQPKPGSHLEFEKVAAPESLTATYEFFSGDLLAQRAPAENLSSSQNDEQETRGVDRAGNLRWQYSTSHPGVSGLFLPPWSPGYVTNEFGIIGHAKSRAGDLGEFVVVHGNNGMWKIWTADGLLAGQILRHKFDPRSTVTSTQSTVKRDQSFNDLTAGQEHFHGYFTQTADGRDYIVYGFNYIGLWEVIGLDDFRRMSGELVVTPEEVRQIRSHQEELARREVKSQAKVMDCLPINGDEIVESAEVEDARLSLGYDREHLYLRWNVTGMGKLENSGDDFHRYFKTGACLDFQLGVDEHASHTRKAPVAGDLRLLFTVAQGQPQAVLYQPRLPNADPKEAWATRTDAGGTTQFDRVVRLTNVKLDFKPDRMQPDRYTFTAVIPLKELGWTPRDGQHLRCDWGVLTSDDGHTVKRRVYWSNTLATGTSDEAWEARLDPHLWGTLAVATKSRSDRQFDLSLPDAGRKPTAGADILDNILNQPKPNQK